jgi:predicted transcriptional regulator
MTIETLPEDGARWDDATTPSLNTIFKVFSEPIRREALVVLRREGKPLSVTALAERLDGETDQMRIALVHAHLPMLANAGLVKWNAEHDLAEFDDFPDEYEGLFEVVEASVR